MSQQNPLLSEEVRDVAIGVIGLFLLAFFRQIRKSIGGDNKVAELEEKVRLVLDSHEALIERLLDDADRRNLQQAEAIIRRERKITSLLAELDKKDRDIERYSQKALDLLNEKEQQKEQGT